MIENAVNEKKSGMISIFRTRKAKIVLLLVVVSICGYMLEQYIVSGERSNITLEKSSGVKVNYISKIPQSSKVANLVPLTEAQVFQE